MPKLICLLLIMFTMTASLARTQPPPPTDVELWKGERSLSVTWTTPDQANLTHELRYSSDSGTNWTHIVGVGNRTHGNVLYELLSGLENAIEYRVQVRAISGSGSGAWSTLARTTPGDSAGLPETLPPPAELEQYIANIRNATPVPIGVPIAGFLSSSSDVDHYQFDVDGTRCLAIMTTGRLGLSLPEVLKWNILEAPDPAIPPPPPLSLSLPIFDARVPDGEYNDALLYFKTTGSFTGTLHFQVASDPDAPASRPGAYTVWIYEFGHADLTWRDFPDFPSEEAECDTNSDRPGDLYFDVPAMNTSAGSMLNHIKLVDGKPVEVQFGLDDEWFRFVIEEQTAVLISAWNRARMRIAVYSESDCCPAADSLADDEDQNALLGGESDLFSSSYGRPYLYGELAPGTYFLRLRRGGTTGGAENAYPTVVYMTAQNLELASRTLDMGTLFGYFGRPFVGRTRAVGPGTRYEFILTEREAVFIRGFSHGGLVDAVMTDSVGRPVGRVHYDQPFWHKGPSGFTITALLDAGAYSVRVFPRSVGREYYYAILGIVDVSQRFLDGCPPTLLSDPYAGCAWHLSNTGSGIDISVGDTWNTYRGEGILVGVVDDSLDLQHADLVQNVEKDLSLDYSGDGNLLGLWANHGTQVAGLIAARDNSFGSRGVAPRAKLFGVNYLDANSTALGAAESMLINVRTAAVSNNSWGPGRIGFTGPALSDAIWRKAIDLGVSRGYGGKGVFYVFAGGNDRAGAADLAYSNLSEVASYYGVAAICAVGEDGEVASYSQFGSNLLLCAPSQKDPHAGSDVDPPAPDPALMTTWPYSRYVKTFNGTSGSAPLVSGVAALVRQACHRCMWRDVRLILAGSATQAGLVDGNWAVGAGKYGSPSEQYRFSHKYGYGLVDLEAAIELAEDWERRGRVGAMIEGTYSSNDNLSLTIPNADIGVAPTPGVFLPLGDTANRDSAFGLVNTITIADSSIDFIEFVAIEMELQSETLRHLRMELESPSGAVSVLTVPVKLQPDIGYPPEVAVDGFLRTGSARHIGETANGVWRLRIRDERHDPDAASTLNSWNLTIFGHIKGSPPAVPRPLPPERDPLPPLPPTDHEEDDDGVYATSECRTAHVTPYWRGNGGFVIRPEGGNTSAEVTVSCGFRRHVSDEFIGDNRQRMIVRLVDLPFCRDREGRARRGTVSFAGIQDNGWYWIQTPKNGVAVAPLVCKDHLDGDVPAFVPNAVQTDVGRYASFLTHVSGVSAIIVHSKELEQKDPLYVAPYWGGAGGFVGEAADPGKPVRVKVVCGNTHSWNTFYADPTGTVSGRIERAFCFRRTGAYRGGRLEVRNLKPGAWFWIDGAKNVAASGFIPEDQLGSREALRPGGLESDRGTFGTLFMSSAGNVGIVPDQ